MTESTMSINWGVFVLAGGGVLLLVLIAVVAVAVAFARGDRKPDDRA